MKKTIEVEVPITVDDIVEFLSSGSASAVKELATKLSINTLSYFASRYVNRVNEEDPETYEKFVQYLPTIKPTVKTESKNMEDKKEEQKPKYELGYRFKIQLTNIFGNKSETECCISAITRTERYGRYRYSYTISTNRFPYEWTWDENTLRKYIEDGKTFL
jgi:hypothetical protein